jgi:hypothetical protein
VSFSSDIVCCRSNPITGSGVQVAEAFVGAKRANPAGGTAERSVLRVIQALSGISGIPPDRVTNYGRVTNVFFDL